LAYSTNIAIDITITSITCLVFVFARIAELKITKKSNVRLKTREANKIKRRKWLEKG